ncbi:MAG: helix-turn-helix domain-containing protein [Planctomycetota bacterium]
METVCTDSTVSGAGQSKGHTTGQICRKLGITEQAYYRWRKQY